MTVKEGNKLIAVFMGLTPQSNGDDRLYKYDVDHYKLSNTCSPDDMMYHCSWGWLMPVVEMIERLLNVDGYKFSTVINDKECTIFSNQQTISKSTSVYSKLNATYEAVVQFIKWYNDENTKHFNRLNVSG